MTLIVLIAQLYCSKRYKVVEKNDRKINRHFELFQKYVFEKQNVIQIVLRYKLKSRSKILLFEFLEMSNS